MLERLGMQLPDWARVSHPLVRYEIGAAQSISRRRRLLQVAGATMLLTLLFSTGYLIATRFLQDVPGQNVTESLSAILFWPTLSLQVLLQIAALALTVNTVSEQKRRQTWDNLRATEGGTRLLLRARWVAVYYRLSPLLALTLLVRAVLIVGILYDLTAFQGRYIDLLVNNITPDVSPLVGVCLLAFVMSASLLLPLTGMGMDAAMGLLVSALVQGRVYSILVQIVLVILRLLLLAMLLIAVTQFTLGTLPLDSAPAWLLMGGFGAMGDWGLSFLHLSFFSEIWATIPFSILLGLALMGFALVQSAFSEWLLAFAIRRAEQIG